MSKVSFSEIWRNDDDDYDDITAYILLAHVNTIVHVSAVASVFIFFIYWCWEGKLSTFIILDIKVNLTIHSSNYSAE